MKLLILNILFAFLINGCATGGHIEGDGTATGGSVDVDMGPIEVSPTVKLK